jgi:hypothetical protein
MAAPNITATYAVTVSVSAMAPGSDYGCHACESEARHVVRVTPRHLCPRYACVFHLANTIGKMVVNRLPPPA